MKTRTRTIRLLAVPLAAALLTAAAAPRHQAAAEEVTYLLPAPAFLPAFAPWMLALGQGYYKAAGLEVKFQTARGGVDVAKQVGAGNAVVGGGIGDTPIIVRPNGIPVRSVALLGGGSLMQLVVNADSGINGPADLKGKTITALSLQDTTYYALLGMLASVGLTKNDVNAQAAGPAGVWKLFLAGKADGMASVADWTVLVQHAGRKVKIFPADRYFKSMAQAILASDKTIEERPALVQKLVDATLKGLSDIMSDPAGAAKHYVAAVPQHKGKEGYILDTFKLYTEHTYSGQAKLGWMDEARLANLQKFYLAQGIIERASPVGDLYTNRFIK